MKTRQRQNRMNSILLIPCVILCALAFAFFLGHSARTSAAPADHFPADVAGCNNLINNGSFETGSFANWTTSGGPWIANYLAHDGTYSGVVGGYDSANDVFSQQLTPPGNATSATLSFWWYIYTQEGGIGTPIAYDFFTMEIEDHTGEIFQLEALDNTSDTENWHKSTIDLDPVEFPSLFGNPIQVRFRGTTDASNFTSFYIDDVQLVVCAPDPTDTPTPDPGCPYDSYEPNDSYYEAAGIETDMSYYSLYLCPEGDEDWYWFNAAAGDEIMVELYNLPADYDLELYDPGENLIGTSAEGGVADERIDHTATEAGAYRVHVFGYNNAWNTTEYVLRVNLQEAATPTWTPTHTPTFTHTPTHTPTSTPTDTPTPEPGCPGDYADDTFATAADIIADNEYTAYLCPTGDEDWFKFNVVSGQKITVQLYNLPADYDLQLYSPSNTMLVDGNQSGTTSEQVFYTATTSGAYRARVYGPGGAASATRYNLKLLLDEPPTATFTPTSTPACVPDNYESNNDADHAYNMGDLHNAPQIFPDQNICPANDEDWFSTRLDADDRIIAELTHDPAQGPLRMCLVDKDKSTALSCTHYDISLNRIDIFVSSEGRYYISIEAATPGDTNPDYMTEIGVTAPTPTWTPTATHTPTRTPTPSPTPHQNSNPHPIATAGRC